MKYLIEQKYKSVCVCVCARVRCRALDDSPLGLRRILSQSTDSLIFRTRTMSVESLTDDGTDTEYLYCICRIFVLNM